MLATSLMVLGSLSGCCALSQLRTDCDEVAARELARLGLDAMHREEFVEAHARFTRALEKSPTNPQARHHLAVLLWEQGDRRKAIEQMDAAVQHCGSQPDWTVQQGDWLLQESFSQAALECADRALTESPALASAWALRGRALKTQQQSEAAIAAFHQATTYNAQDYDSLLAMAGLYRASGRPRRALSVLQRMDAAGPPSNRLLYEQAAAMFALRRHEDASDLLTQHRDFRQPSAEDRDLRVLLVECQLASGQVAAAQATLASFASGDQDPVLVALRRRAARPNLAAAP